MCKNQHLMSFITFYFHNAVDSMPTITFGNNFSKNDEIAQLFNFLNISVYSFFIFPTKFLCIPRGYC